MGPDRLEASVDIDRASSLEIVRIIQQQDRLVVDAVAAEAEKIAHAIDQIADRLSHGGRLIYAGAGTSGRIAMLDASELPPTYGIDRDLVRVIIAGGQRAFFEAAEGAEDDGDAAIEAVNTNVRPEDALVRTRRLTPCPALLRIVRTVLVIGDR